MYGALLNRYNGKSSTLYSFGDSFGKKETRKMAEDGPPAGGEERSSAGPALLSDPAILLMDDVSQKLKLLNYEADFCLAKDIPPFSRIHFAVPSANSS